MTSQLLKQRSEASVITLQSCNWPGWEEVNGDPPGNASTRPTSHPILPSHAWIGSPSPLGSERPKCLKAHNISQANFPGPIDQRTTSQACGRPTPSLSVCLRVPQELAPKSAVPQVSGAAAPLQSPPPFLADPLEPIRRTPGRRPSASMPASSKPSPSPLLVKPRRGTTSMSTV